jgi:hypothetical protein
MLDAAARSVTHLYPALPGFGFTGPEKRQLMPETKNKCTIVAIEPLQTSVVSGEYSPRPYAPIFGTWPLMPLRTTLWFKHNRKGKVEKGMSEMEKLN